MHTYARTSTRVLIGLFALIILLTVSQCAGTKLLDEPVELQVTQPLATYSDENIELVLDWVIVRDGPGTWARNTDWDEYLLRVRNQSDLPLEVTNVVVVDSLDFRLLTNNDRSELVDASELTAERYDESEIEIRAGQGTTSLLTAGAVTSATGLAVASATMGPIMAGGSAAGAAVGGVLFLAGPAIAIGGIVRWRNNRAVDREIERRHTSLPVQVQPEEEQDLDLFFPLAPSPQTVEVTYADATGEHIVYLDTGDALVGLHIDPES